MGGLFPVLYGGFTGTDGQRVYLSILLLRNLQDPRQHSKHTKDPTMANVHGLFGKKDGNNKDDDEKDESNNRYVGGIGDRGGGRYV